MYTEASGHAPGDVARLVSAADDIRHPSCLTIHYLLYGVDIYRLSFYLYHSDNILHPIDTILLAQGLVWHTVSFNIPAGKLRLLIEYERGWFYQSDAAIDDIIVTTGSCVDIGK